MHPRLTRGPSTAGLPYGSRSTNVSQGWPYLAATSAVSAASRKGSQSRQMRPPRFESQEESSCSVLHRAHMPRTAIGNVLMARLMTILRFLVKRQPAAAAAHLWRIEEPSMMSLENLRHQYEPGTITNSVGERLNKLYVVTAPSNRHLVEAKSR